MNFFCSVGFKNVVERAIQLIKSLLPSVILALWQGPLTQFIRSTIINVHRILDFNLSIFTQL